MLNKKINTINIEKEYELERKEYIEKIGILDIKAVINDTNILDLEMQNKDINEYTKRVMLYSGKLITSQLKSGDDYSELKDVIIINILDFIMFKDIKKIHTVWQYREKDEKWKVLNGNEIHFIELPKFRKSNPDLSDKLMQWLALIDTGNERWLNSIMKENEIIEKALNEAKEFEADKKSRRLIELMEKKRMDESVMLKSAIKKGKEEGLIEGRKEGHAEGKKEGLREVAIKMLKSNIDIEIIKNVTGFTDIELKEML